MSWHRDDSWFFFRLVLVILILRCCCRDRLVELKMLHILALIARWVLLCLLSGSCRYFMSFLLFLSRRRLMGDPLWIGRKVGRKWESVRMFWGDFGVEVGSSLERRCWLRCKGCGFVVGRGSCYCVALWYNNFYFFKYRSNINILFCWQKSFV